MKPVMDFLTQWNKKNTSFGKLQGAYVVLALSTLIVAAIIGLVNYRLGQSILYFAFIFAMVFFGNGIVWALVQTFVTSRLEKKPTKTTKK